MESDELYIRERFGKKKPFVVPNGYFDGLCDRLEKHTIVTVAHVTFWRHYRNIAVAVAFI